MMTPTNEKDLETARRSLSNIHSGDGNEITINEMKRVFSLAEKVLVGLATALLVASMTGLLATYVTVNGLTKAVTSQEVRLGSIENKLSVWAIDGTPSVKPALQDIKDTLRSHENTFRGISGQIADAREAQIRFEGKIDNVTSLLNQHERESNDALRRGKPQASVTAPSNVARD
jgi:hypothetical protein